MSDSFTTNLNLTKPEEGASTDTWGGKLNDDMDVLDAIFADDGSGSGVGLQATSGKTWKTVAGATLRFIASTFGLYDDTDTTKIVKFDASGLTTGTTRTYTMPDESDTLATHNYVRSYVPTGTVFHGYFAAIPAGFVALSGDTIGDASSGASARANADCEDLFLAGWALGWTVVTGAGASAAADWAAHKAITLPDHRGRTMAAPDNNLGASNAARLSTAMASNAPGLTGGAQTETASVSVSGTVVVAGSTSGALSVVATGTTGVDNALTNVTVGPTSVAAHTHAHDVTVTGSTSGALTVAANGGNSMTGSTSSATNVQPTILVPAIIAL